MSCPTRGLDTVLLAPEQDQLETLGWLSQFRHRLNLLLILPDHHPDTTRLGHALQPRFITYADANWSELIEVLRLVAVKRANVLPDPAERQPGSAGARRGWAG